eukprot:CAMPEP_0204139226 /NCGR_PEP_ID=MMETSP0361-20130328/18366_1 /ASSEMBLY_ACC=CAM_ASM_000343 /TAXON_ID=268821 /ORGANISM="Scrippsiella Hangoei, Strain SHTV-5" /LENGTH=357 /DNA_ID=CAMNT_0051093023 /DNA_START=50 /DNA_END=1123 /DNA_ORIENTATION=+
MLLPSDPLNEQDAYLSCSASTSSSESAQGETSSKSILIRKTLTWLCFVSYLCFEVGLHMKYGLNPDTFESEESCVLTEGDLPFRCEVLIVFEIMCRSCLTVVFASSLWEFATAMVFDALAICCRNFAGGMVGDLWAFLVSMAIAVLGIWNALGNEETFPGWAQITCHVLDAFCHAIILSAIVGFAYDFVDRLCSGRDEFCKFVCGLMQCFDTLEAHGVVSVDLDAEGSEEGREVEKIELQATRVRSERRRTAAWSDQDFEIPMQDVVVVRSLGAGDVLDQQRKRHEGRNSGRARALFIWFVFLVMLVALIMDSYWPDTLPTWVGKWCKLEGSLCWAGIAWWLVKLITSSKAHAHVEG